MALGIVRIQPPTGSPYMEPPVVKRMARNLPPRFDNYTNIPSLGSNGTVAAIGIAGMLIPIGLLVGTIALGVYAVKKLSK
ncbi:MAG: hypothetical protein JSV86_17265 [Gemmatimonadota bacterium]|nr:MAG: hypothetical protein JSV86_17265 [Gemmatimonadota bacterium]